VRQGIIDARPDDDVLDDIRTHLWRLRQEQVSQNRQITFWLVVLAVLQTGLIAGFFWGVTYGGCGSPLHSSKPTRSPNAQMALLLCASTANVGRVGWNGMKALIPDRRQARGRDMSAAHLILMFCFWVGFAWFFPLLAALFPS
jgi:hypothetical protein